MAMAAVLGGGWRGARERTHRQPIERANERMDGRTDARTDERAGSQAPVAVAVMLAVGGEWGMGVAVLPLG